MPSGKAFAFVAAVFLVAAGCSVPPGSPKQGGVNKSEDHRILSWPPPSPPRPQSSAAAGLQKMIVSGYGIAYKTEKKGTTNADHVGWGPKFDDGEWVLPYNLFTIKGAGACYVENQFEVVYHDSNSTEIRALPDRQDHVVMIQSQSDGSYRATFDCSGGQVRLLGQNYALKTDGWYLDGVLVHAFATTNSQ